MQRVLFLSQLIPDPPGMSASNLVLHDSLRQLNLAQLTHLPDKMRRPNPEQNRPLGVSLRQISISWITASIYVTQLDASKRAVIGCGTHKVGRCQVTNLEGKVKIGSR